MNTVLREQKKKNTAFCEYYETSKHFDLFLSIDATNMCQLRCGYCYFGEKGHQKMDANKIMAAVNNLVPIFGSKLNKVRFHYMGGEPFLAWEEILALNAAARMRFEEKGIKFSWALTSNLIALDEKKTEHMLREEAGIHCSIDGPARIQNKNRPRMNGMPSFPDVAKNIPLALQITPDDTARATVCPEDAESIPEIVETIFNLGFQSIALFPALSATGMEWNNKAIDQWQKGIATAYEETYKSNQAQKRIITLVAPLQKEKECFAYCGAGKALWSLDVNGNLYFCHRITSSPQFAIIDASQSTSETIQRAIERSIIPPLKTIPEFCLGCSAKDYCQGGCWIENLIVNGNSMIPYSAICQITRATAPVIGDFLTKDAVVNCGWCGWCMVLFDCKGCFGCVSGDCGHDKFN